VDVDAEELVPDGAAVCVCEITVTTVGWTLWTGTADDTEEGVLLMKEI
jgi:hypothetical protein